MITQNELPFELEGGMRPKSYAILAVAALILIIMLQNLDSVYIQILFWYFSLPLILLILLATVVGFIIGYFFSSISPKKHK
jgi:uncharacterized integral membrane protein